MQSHCLRVFSCYLQHDTLTSTLLYNSTVRLCHGTVNNVLISVDFNSWRLHDFMYINILCYYYSNNVRLVWNSTQLSICFLVSESHLPSNININSSFICLDFLFITPPHLMLISIQAFLVNFAAKRRPPPAIRSWSYYQSKFRRLLMTSSCLRPHFFITIHL